MEEKCQGSLSSLKTEVVKNKCCKKKTEVLEGKQCCDIKIDINSVENVKRLPRIEIIKN